MEDYVNCFISVVGGIEEACSFFQGNIITQY